jgi:WD40 repeat protein
MTQAVGWASIEEHEVNGVRMKKALVYSWLLISTGLLMLSCGTPREPTTTSMPVTTLTATAIPAPVPAPSPAELFSKMSQSWKVAFVDTSSRKLCVMYGDGSSTSCLDYIDYDLPNGYRKKLGVWSPDGSKFAYDRNDDTGIFIWDLNGHITAFQESGEGLVFRRPFWSTNGEYIAYQIEPVGGWNIPADVPGTYIESLDHSYKIRVSAERVSVDWSPDGQSLLFSDEDIHIAMSDGADPHKLTHDTAGYLYATWSPDGLHIAFLRRAGSYNELYIMNADGSRIHKVANLDIRNAYAMFNYTWLPPGRYILYDNQLIDIETGISSELSFPFDPSSAVWFTKPNGNGIATRLASH